MRRASLLVASAALALAALGRCQCGDSVNSRPPELRVVVPDSDGTSLDFGQVRTGVTVPRELHVENVGRITLTLAEVTLVDGEDVALMSTESPAAPFRLEPLAGVELAPGESRMLRVEVQASATAEHSEATPHRSVVRIAPVGGEGADIELRVVAVPDACDVPGVVDFGHVWAGTSFDSAVVFPAASGQVATTGWVSDVQNYEGPFFSALYRPGEFQAPADAAVKLPIRFSPRGVYEYHARLTVRRSERCEEEEVQLVGRGIVEGVVLSPVPVECGYVPAGLSREVYVAARNVTWDDVTLSAFRADGPFQWKQDVPLVLPSGAETTLAVVCGPMGEGPPEIVEATLSFDTSFPRQPTVSVPVRAYRGGPDIHVEPEQVDFGRVAYVEGASPPVRQRRRVYVSNVGDEVPEPAGNLLLGRAGERGGFGPPYLEVIPRNSTLSTEFTARIRTSYDSGLGIAAVSGGRKPLRIDVDVIPDSEGVKEAELVIYSNDIDEPIVRIPVRAEAVAAADCQYTAGPADLELGTMAFPGTTSRMARVRNIADGGSNACFISVLDVEPVEEEFSSDPWISWEIRPGEYVDVPVNFAPEPVPYPWTTFPNGGVHSGADGGWWRVMDAGWCNPVPPYTECWFPPRFTTELVSGVLTLSVSSVTASTSQTQLRADSAPPCLVAIPQEVDFGAVALGCTSAPRRIRFYNGCWAEEQEYGTGIQIPPVLHVDPATIALGASSVGCSGCEPFAVSSSDIHDGGVALLPWGDPVYIDVSFRPSSLEGVHSAIAIPVGQYDAGVTVIVPLFGSGAVTTQREDEFVQSSTPTLDIILAYSPEEVADAGMWAANADAIAGILLASPIDFHLAVTWPNGHTDPSKHEPDPPPGFRGAFLLDGSATEPFLQRSTAQFEGTLEARLYGATPWATAPFETFTLALSPPRALDENIGFRRHDAPLLGLSAVVGDDASPLGGSVYHYGEPLLTSHAKLISLAATRRVTISGAIVPPTQSDAGICDPTGLLACENYASSSHIALMAQLTGGVVADSVVSTAPNGGNGYSLTLWASEFEDSIYKAAGLPRTFELGTVPVAGTLDVLVDGVLTPASGPTGTVWTWDAVTNSVVFEKAHRPAPGSRIGLRYTPVCN